MDEILLALLIVVIVLLIVNLIFVIKNKSTKTLTENDIDRIVKNIIDININRVNDKLDSQVGVLKENNNLLFGKVEDSVKDMALSRVDAIDRCISLGKQFIKHFDKIYNNSNEQSVNHLINEMNNWYKSVKQIILKNTNKPILNGELRDWFFTAGANPESFMKSPTNDELEKYDIFIDKILAGNNINSVLKEMKIIDSI